MNASLNWLAANLLLKSAIVVVHGMQWLFRWRLISREDSDQFLQLAKKIEDIADGFATRAMRRR